MPHSHSSPPANSAREIALRVLHQVDTRQAYANALLHQVLNASNLPDADRALVTTLVDGTLRWQARLDYVLAHFSRYDLAQLPAWIRVILRMGAYQLLFLDKIPAHAVVNESANLARRHGHTGTIKLTNAVLRRLSAEQAEIRWPEFQADPTSHLTIVESHPKWLVTRWVERFSPDEALALCRANNQPPPMTIRVNSLWVERAALIDLLARDGLLAHPCRWAPDGLQLEHARGWEQSTCYQEGLFTVQGEGSMLIGLLADPQPGWRVADLCSGVGGKTTHLAELMQNQGSILACDQHIQRLQQLRQSAQRLGLDILRTRSGDARQLKPTGNFDLVLLDAPCSGTGTLGRRPDLRWRKSEGQLANLNRLQSELLEVAHGLLRTGGILLYSTCSLEPEENEQVIIAFLSAHSEYRQENPPKALKSLPQDAISPAGAVTLFPHRHGTDGMYGVRLRKGE